MSEAEEREGEVTKSGSARSVTGEDMDKVMNNAKLAGSIMEDAVKADDMGADPSVRNKLLSAAHDLIRENARIMREWGV